MRDYGEHTRVNDSMAIKPHTKADAKCQWCGIPWRYPLDMSEFRAVLMPRGDMHEEPMAQYTQPY